MHNRLKYLRRKLGLSQQEVAEDTGMQQKTVSDIENGKVANIPHSYIIYFKQKDISLDWIYTGEGEYKKINNSLFSNKQVEDEKNKSNTIAYLERIIKSKEDTIEALRSNIGSLNYIINQLEKKSEKD